MFALLAFVGCRADVTERIAVHGNSATVSIREVIDQQMYSLAMQGNNKDPFDADALNAHGWTVSRYVDDSNNHVISLSRDTLLDDLSNVWTQAPISGKMDSPPPTSGGTVGSIERGLFSDTVSFHTTVPNLMGANASNSGDNSSEQMQAAGRSIAATMIGLHFELQIPGKVVASNAETTPDGALRWDIALDHPTEIQATYSIPDGGHIVEAIATGAVIFAVAALVLVRRSRSRSPSSTSAEQLS